MKAIRKETQINGLLSPLLQRLRIRKALPFFYGRRVLDIGCSNGELLIYLPKDIEYIGVEGKTTYFKKAQELNPRHKFLNIYLDGDSVKQLNIEKVDTIFMLAVLEHLYFPLKTLENLKSYLAEEGRIVITTPSERAKNILRFGSKIGFFMNEMHEHKNHFSKGELMRICQGAELMVLHYSRFEFGLNHLLVLKNGL